MSAYDDRRAEVHRLFHAERWPVGAIAHALGMHRSTVHRLLVDGGVSRASLKRRPSQVDPYLPFIEETLAKYPTVRSTRVWSMVRERGYTGSKDYFRAIVATLRPRKPAEAFLRVSVMPGEQAQVDWAHFGTLGEGRSARPLMAFVMVLSHSRRIFLRFFLSGNTAAFLQGHVEAFRAFSGVPRDCLYDNLKSAVLERQGAAIRFNPQLLELATHYCFEPKPVNVARGNEKGRVERAIRYIREGFFTARTFTGVDDLNAQARAWCEGESSDRRHPEQRERTVRDVFDEEKSKLRALPEHPFEVRERAVVTCGKTPYVRFDSNDYSVPADRVRRALRVEATETRVRIFDEMEAIAEHARRWDKHARVEDPAHIAALEASKREAREHRRNDRLRATAPHAERFLVETGLAGASLGSVVKQLNDLLDRFGADAVDVALAQALAAGTVHVGAVRQLLDVVRDNAPPPVRVPLQPRAAAMVVRPHALAGYDRALAATTEDLDAIF